MRHGTTSTTNIGSSSSSVKVAVAHVWLAYGRQLRHLVLDVPSWGEPTKGQVAVGLHGASDWHPLVVLQ